MKRIAVLLFAVAVAIAGVSASGAPEGSELSLGLGYDYDLYGATGIHGLGINMYCQQPVAESADLYWNIDIMVPFQVIALGTSVGRDAYDTLFGMGVSFGGGKAFMVGDNVRIASGPLETFLATVEEIYPDKQKVKVIVQMFGRQTPVELEFNQIEKLSN